MSQRHLEFSFCANNGGGEGFVDRDDRGGEATSARQQVSSLSPRRHAAQFPAPAPAPLYQALSHIKLTESDSSRPKFRCGHSRYDRLK
ncbi:unnamed protein product, partial [Brenthis ino]